MSSGGSKKPKRKPGLMTAISYYLTAPGRWIAESGERRRQRALRDGDAPASLMQSILRTFAFPFVVLGETFGRTFSFLGGYLQTRNGLYLLQAIPAILVFSGTIALAALALSLKRTDLVKKYQSEGDRAVRTAQKIEEEVKKTELLDRAQLCYERWMMLEPDNPEAKFKHAMAAYETGDPVKTETALNEMRQLAPHDKPGGFEGAHQWLAQFYIKQMDAQQTDRFASNRVRNLAEVHLMRVLMADNDDYMAHRSLAQLYISQRRFEKAEKHLQLAAALDPAANADLASLYAKMQLPDAARQKAQQALSYFESLSERDPDDVKYRFIIADLLVILDRNEDAIGVLEDGIKLTGDNEINKKASRLLLTMMQKVPEENIEERLRLFDEAMRIDPTNTIAFQFILYYLKQANPVAQMAQERIDNALAATNSPTLHILLSEFYLRENKPDLARRHLEAILRAEPNFLPAMNNLANVYAMMKPPDYNRALDIIDECLSFAQEKGVEDNALAHFLDTRGQVFAAQRQWTKAASDLERAIAYGLNNNINTHTTLLRCYQELNRKDLAEEEIRLIASLKRLQEREAAKAETNE